MIDPFQTNPPGPPQRLPGDIVFRRYELQERLGKGAMGEVWKARDQKLGRVVALKFLLGTCLMTEKERERLRQEALMAIGLHHTHIVGVYDYADEPENSFADGAIVMEYVEGGTLTSERESRPGEVFEEAELRPLIEQAAEALRHAHLRKVLHRDLKPENLMLAKVGAKACGGLVKLMDFGLAETARETLSMRSGAVRGEPGISGTLAYMSPQQMSGMAAHEMDDWYSLGATIYELMTGKPPFFRGRIEYQIEKLEAPTMGERRAELGVKGGAISKEWEEIVAGLLSKKREDRAAAVECLLGRDKTASRVEAAVVDRAPASMEGTRAGEVREFGGIEMVWCPPGEFWMGSPEGEAGRRQAETRHHVTLTKGFWLAKTECTQGQWKSVMGSNPSHFKGADLPVETVSWEEVQVWLKEMNERHPLPVGWVWELPTEAQWEYACRAGTETAFHFGSVLNGREANCDGNGPYGTSEKGPYLGKTTKVGSYAQNQWGLYDMHGNVWEWCRDWYGDYPSGAVTDPSGPETGVNRVNRGGSWGFNAQYCRSAYRSRRAPDDRLSYLGFRPALVPSIR